MAEAVKPVSVKEQANAAREAEVARRKALADARAKLAPITTPGHVREGK